MTTKAYPDPDLVFKNVKVMWARVLPDNPYEAKQITSNGKKVWVQERWSFDIVLNEAQAAAARAKEAYVKSATNEETGETSYFLSMTKNTKGPDGSPSKPFYIVHQDSGNTLTEDMANGSIMDVELYLSENVSAQSGARKAYLKRGVVTEFIPYEQGGASQTVDAPDSSEVGTAANTNPRTKGKKAESVADDGLGDDLPF